MSRDSIQAQRPGAKATLEAMKPNSSGEPALPRVGAGSKKTIEDAARAPKAAAMPGARRKARVVSGRGAPACLWGKFGVGRDLHRRTGPAGGPAARLSPGRTGAAGVGVAHGDAPPLEGARRLREHHRGAEDHDGSADPDGDEVDGAALESRMLTDALPASGGDRSEAARRLGISRVGLGTKLKRLGLDGGR